MDEKSAEKLVEVLGINDPTTKQILMEPPLKAQTSSDVLLQDPCIYRLHEVNLIYGLALKEVIQEKFGDGIMSAIDFMVDVEKEQPENEPPRVKIVMSGKFLPYKRW
jgi:cyanate lyase